MAAIRSQKRNEIHVVSYLKHGWQGRAKFSQSVAYADRVDITMDRWFDIGTEKVYIRELILSGELGTQIWDAIILRILSLLKSKNPTAKRNLLKALFSDLVMTVSQTFVMFRYIETELDYYKGKRILELGSGTGILGIGVAKIGAKEVVITDLPQLVGLMEENIKMNNLDNCKAAALTWGDDPAPFNPPFDVILIADVITELYVDHFSKLVQTMKDMSDMNTRIILGFEKRMRNKEETFFKLLLDNHFTHNIIDDAYKWDPTYDSDTRMTIYEIRRKPE